MSQAQPAVSNSSNLKQKTFRVIEDSIRVDSMSIIPESFSVNNVVASDYRLDFVNAILYWINKPTVDSVTITYRVFPFRFNAAIQRMNFDSVVNNFYIKPFEFNNASAGSQQKIFDFGKLRAEGSLGRQIGFGNSQDAVLNSTLNLQLGGYLGDSIELQAAITDNNIPIQPDGTTQQLNEFDQVYLRFSKKNWQLNLGDIDIRQSNSYFLNFYKRLQGLSFETTNQLAPNLQARSLVSGSIAKGKFTRNVIQGLEGNQGPYRLAGANNEFFFIILANTERVYLDGELLQRGEDRDYVINYNSSEVTFTPRRMITKDSRIQVEFEYADRNFLNANLFLSEELEIGKKLKLRVGAFNNSDAKNSQVNQVLSTAQKQFLTNIGDSIQNAFYPSAVIDTFSSGKILYEKIYFNTGTGIDSFYQYSINPSALLFNLSFTDVGQGNGNYVPDFNGANGKVFRFIMPVSGVKQGRFEPVQILVTPKKQQLLNLGIDYTIAKSTLLKTEIATSSTDVNTFSNKDDGDDRGWAGRFILSNAAQLNRSRKLFLNTAIDYEYVQDKFKPLERLRNVEFTRDWGLGLPVRSDTGNAVNLSAFLIPSVTEHIIKAQAGLIDQHRHAFNYQFINYRRSDDYSGYQNLFTHIFNLKGWVINNQFMLTKYNTRFDKGSFLRPVIDMSKQFSSLKNWRLGFRYAIEQNESRHRLTDTLTPLAFSFSTYSVYLRSDERKRNRHSITFFTRSDKYPVVKDLVGGDRSLNLNLQTELLANQNRQFYLNTTFRKLKVLDNSVTRQKEDETILGRAEYVMNEWKGLLHGNVLYEVGAGQEQRRDFAYLEVPQGTGVYAWIDYNNDAIQQLNEFELAAFPDQAKFIRILTPTNEFVKANYITFNYSLSVSPRAVLNKTDMKPLPKFISKFNLLTSLQISKKSIARGDFEFNPFKYDVQDTALTTLNNVFLNTISFNRFSHKWGIDFSNFRNYGKSLLTYGYESRKINDWLVKTRWNLNRTVQLNVNGKLGSNILLTPQFNNRNFDLAIYSAEPQLNFVRGTKLRVVTGYKIDLRRNAEQYGGEQSTSHAFNLESKYNILQNSSISGRFTFNTIYYNAVANSTVSYIMLEGLLPGKNYLWTLSFNKRLINNLELNFQYDGRKSGKANTVHVGRAGLTALF